MRFPNARQLQGRAKRRIQLASDLYDTGKPKPIIVEHEHRHTVEVQPAAPVCRAAPGWLCSDVVREYGPCAVCPFKGHRSGGRAQQSEVTITHEFIDEPSKRKQLK